MTHPVGTWTSRFTGPWGSYSFERGAWPGHVSFLKVLLVFFFTSFWIFRCGIEPFSFCECLFSLQHFRWRRHRNVRLEVRVDGGRRSTFVSVNPFFLIPREMGKKLLAVNSTDSVFAEFLLHRMFNCKQRSRWNQLKAKQASQSNMNNALFNLTYEASDILNVNLSSGVSRLKPALN